MKAWEYIARDPVLAPYLPSLKALSDDREAALRRNPKGVRLSRALEMLPRVNAPPIDVDRDCIRIGTPADLDPAARARLYEALGALKPWRKGPFDIFGIRVESEWDSAVKWNRLADHLGSQAGRRVLDIGSSCGYYLFRLASRRPAVALGIEPTLNLYYQYRALSRYLPLPGVGCLPLKLEELPPMAGGFDTVLCMGILYHRRSPLDTLQRIRRLMAPGGQLVIETLIIDGDTPTALFPETRYACMNNVYFIPTIPCLSHWLGRCGFGDVRCVDVSRTTSREQRRTEWIDTQSLADFLDPDDPARTREGYPAPVRAMVLAGAPDR